MHKEEVWPVNSDSVLKKPDFHRMFGVQIPTRCYIQQIIQTLLFTTYHPEAMKAQEQVYEDHILI